MRGDAIKAIVMGNLLCGDAEVVAWENLLDLSHSVYPGSCHSIDLFISKRDLRDTRLIPMS